MEVENMRSTISKEEVEEEEDDDVELPGFRFHPTDEELVGFYLRRKVEKKPIRLELIKLVDIYKFDPWDLPKTKGAGDKEWYFFCRRGRKYKNSVRPNRVTRSGFWKATGIDRPIYSSTRECIGLKKSLVYYRGSAGKGTKTDWMMHEFRLPTAHDKSTKHVHAKPINIPQEPAEVWTLCRILKRNVSYRKCVPEWREMESAKRTNNNIIHRDPAVVIDAGSQTCSVESCDQNGKSSSSYNISFRAPMMNVMTSSLQQQQQQQRTHENKLLQSFSINNGHHHHHRDELIMGGGSYNSSSHEVEAPSVASSYVYGDINEFLRHADWEDLRSVVDCAAAANANPSSNSHQYY